MNPLDWLFGTRTGVIVLVVGGIFICLIIAFIAERRMRKVYFNHEKDENDDSILGSLFDDKD